MWHLTCDTWHLYNIYNFLSPFFPFLSVLEPMLLLAQVKRLSVSCMRDLLPIIRVFKGILLSFRYFNVFCQLSCIVAKLDMPKITLLGVQFSGLKLSWYKNLQFVSLCSTFCISLKSPFHSLSSITLHGKRDNIVSMLGLRYCLVFLLADPGKARSCYTNTVVSDRLI